MLSIAHLIPEIKKEEVALTYKEQMELRGAIRTIMSTIDSGVVLILNDFNSEISLYL